MCATRCAAWEVSNRPWSIQSLFCLLQRLLFLYCSFQDFLSLLLHFLFFPLSLFDRFLQGLCFFLLLGLLQFFLQHFLFFLSFFEVLFGGLCLSLFGDQLRSLRWWLSLFGRRRWCWVRIIGGRGSVCGCRVCRLRLILRRVLFFLLLGLLRLFFLFLWRRRLFLRFRFIASGVFNLLTDKLDGPYEVRNEPFLIFIRALTHIDQWLIRFLHRLLWLHILNLNGWFLLQERLLIDLDLKRWILHKD